MIYKNRSALLQSIYESVRRGSLMFNPEFRVEMIGMNGKKFYIGGLEYDSFRDEIGFLLYDDRNAKVFAGSGFRPLDILNFSDLSKVSQAAVMSRNTLEYSYDLCHRIGCVLEDENLLDLSGKDTGLPGVLNYSGHTTDAEVMGICKGENDFLNVSVRMKKEKDGIYEDDTENRIVPLSRCSVETMAFIADTIAKKYPAKESLLKDASSDIYDRELYENRLSRYFMRLTSTQDREDLSIKGLELRGGTDPEISFVSGCLKYDNEHGMMIYGETKGKNGMEIVKMPVSALTPASLYEFNKAMTVRYPSWAAYYREQRKQDSISSPVKAKSNKKLQELSKNVAYSYSPRF